MSEPVTPRVRQWQREDDLAAENVRLRLHVEQLLRANAVLREDLRRVERESDRMFALVMGVGV